jgi:carbamoyltransferase
LLSFKSSIFSLYLLKKTIFAALMTILGIHGDIFNKDRLVFESNAAIVVDGKVKAAVSEERLSRAKMDGRYPFLSIPDVLQTAGCSLSDVDDIVISGLKPSDTIKSYAASTVSTFMDTGVLVSNPQKAAKHIKGLFRFLSGSGKSNTTSGKIPGAESYAKGPVFLDHHLSHAAGAYYASPFDDALIITLDGGGDGLDGTAYIGKGNKLERIIAVPHFQSPGTMYSAITYDMGFIRHRHEGKITGLAALGIPSKERLGLENLMRYSKSKHRFISRAVARHARDLNTVSDYFGPLLKTNSRADLAATVQNIFEDVILEFAMDAYSVAKKQGFTSKNICLAGGCFANVRLNQKLLELPVFDNIYIFPAMGDGGLAAGAAIQHYYNTGNRERNVSKLEHVYLGRDFSDAQMEQALKNANLAYTKPAEPEKEVARLLADEKVVGRFNGAMEYGPRALGNRSILGAPFDKTINDWLNKKLHRTEFMPFAPSMTVEAAPDYLKGYRDDHIAADFMTLTYDILPGQAEKIPAVVHVDNTARPQVVRKEINPSFHKIIDEFGKITGIPVVLNTSFNIHEEPIVYTPEDAIRGFLDAKLDYFSMGPFLTKLPG